MELTINPPDGRGCGKDRDEGALYACCGVGDESMPVEHFLLDPVRPRPWQRGYLIKADSSGIYHLIIYVGIDGGKGGPGYPSAWSYVEETRGYGASRKVPRTILKNPDFYNLNDQSRMVLVHPRALPLFGFGLNRKNRPLVGCKFFQDWVENKEHWEMFLQHQSYRNFVAGHHPANGGYKVGNKRHYMIEPCTLALRDLSFFNHVPDEDKELLDPIEQDWFRFQIKSASSTWTGNVPNHDIEFGQENYGIKFASAAFLSLPLHFEIPKRDKHNIASKVAQAGFQPVVTEW